MQHNLATLIGSSVEAEDGEIGIKILAAHTAEHATEQQPAS
jgi:hypothetical protein